MNNCQLDPVGSTSGFLKFNFLAALAGTFGSLFFSEVMHFPPCTLCWYQRIFLYPLVFIFGVAIWKQDGEYKKYALPIAIAGLATSIYHNLLYYGFISEALAPCTQDVSCSSKQLELLGFITIPLLSMVGFLIIVALIGMDSKKHGRVLSEK